jgi:hypothetical protein
MASAMEFELQINPDDQHTFGPCTCCGNMTRRVWGYLYDGEIAVGAYFVEWTPGHVEAAANFDLILGKWGPGSATNDRKAVAVAYRNLETGPAFMVINAQERSLSASSLVGEALAREQVIGQPLADSVFAACDAIFLRDPRIADLRPS